VGSKKRNISLRAILTHANEGLWGDIQSMQGSGHEENAIRNSRGGVKEFQGELRLLKLPLREESPRQDPPLERTNVGAGENRERPPVSG